MKSITELVDVPEEEYSLYVQGQKGTGVAYGSDNSDDANFRFETENKQTPKSQFFGKVKSPFPETSYAGAAGRGFGRFFTSALGDTPIALGQAISESSIGETFRKVSVETGRSFSIPMIEQQMQSYAKSRGVDNMTMQEKADFYKNDEGYRKLYAELDKTYDRMIELDDPEYNEKRKDYFKQLHQRVRDFESFLNIDPKKGDVQWITELADGAASLVSVIAISALTKSPTAAASVFGTMQGSNLYTELREKGVEPKNALLIAGAGGTVEGMLEEWGLHRIFENMSVKKFTSAIAKSFLTEATQEGSQQTAEEALMWKFRQDESLKEKGIRIVKSAAMGGVLGPLATTVGRPLMMKNAAHTKAELVENYGVNPDVATELVGQATYGNAEQREQASHDIQVAIGSAQLQQMGLSQEESESLAEKFVITNKDYQDEVLRTAEAELDPETYEGNSLASGAKFLDSQLKRDFVGEQFDISEKVQELAIENNLPPEEAKMAGNLVESFSRVVYNKTGETPAEFWEHGGKVMIRDARPHEMEDVPEEEISETERTEWDDGSYVGEDGLIHAKDGSVLFQTPIQQKDLAQRINEIDAEEQAKGVPEYTKPTININGVERQTTNSEGNPIAKSEKSLRYFYDWFGDSKIVDKQGRPLVVYHGTNAVFEEFDITKVINGRASGNAFYFTKNKGRARGYGENLLELYLSIKNPFTIDDNPLEKNVYVKFAKDFLGFNDEKAEKSYIENNGQLKNVHFFNLLTKEHPEKASEFLQSLGYDGVFSPYNVFDLVLAFNKNQIKSKENIGTYSLTDGRILFQTPIQQVQYTEPKIEINGIERKTTNADGKPITTTAENLRNFYNWFKDSKAVDAEGRPVPVYHGTKRGDRVGDRFRKDRATSGPMAFSTDNRRIAENYSKSKNDTSLFDVQGDYYKWFTIKGEDGRDYALDDIWNHLSSQQRNLIRERAGHITTDENAENIIYDESKEHGNGGYYPSSTMNNAIRDLVEAWLNSGSLFDQEEKFLDVLELAGIPKELVYYIDPRGDYSKVFEMYVSIQNPLVTSNIPQSVVGALEKRSLTEKEPEYENGADMWDKNTRDPKEWVESLKEDLKEGTTYSWTSIPDWVTDTLKQLGYDGIKDTGGKGGGEIHTVWIPFEENQYKSMENVGTFSLENPSILYQGETQAPMGSYTQRAYEKIVDIFKNGNPSTLVHELGHYFTLNYIDILQKYNQLDELNDLLSWFGVGSVNELFNEDGSLQEVYAEKFARGFETYAMEGVSPNAKVQSIFERFKQWLLKVYENLVPEQINDSVRSFFDKMLASDEEFDYAGIMRLGSDIASLQQVVKSALEGKAVEIGGINIADVKRLVKTLSKRIPRMPKNLKEILKDVGLEEGFAKSFDLQYALGVSDLLKDEETLKDLKKRKLITQKQINDARKLVSKEGGITREDELIEYLQSLGLLAKGGEDYADTSALWDEAMNLLENAENVYLPADMQQVELREQIMDAIAVAEQALQGVDYEDILKAVNALSKEGITSVQKETLKYIKAKQKEIESGYKALLKKMLKAQKEDMQEVRDAVVDFIKGQPLTGDDKVKLLGFIKKANSMNSLQKISETIKNKAQEYYDREQRTLLNREIQKELKQTRAKSMDAQKYDYENNKLFIELRAYNKYTKEKAADALAKLPMDEESVSGLDEVELIKRRFLAYKSRGADATSDLMNQVLNDIVNAKEKGAKAKSEEEHNRMLAQEEDRQELLSILDEKKADKKSVSEIAQKGYRRGFTNLYSLLNSIFGKKVADKYQLEVKQATVESNIYFKTSDVIKNSARIFSVKGRTGLLDLFSEMAQQKYTITNEDGINKEIDTFGIIDIYNAIKNDKTRNDYYSAFGEEQVNGLVNMLTVQQRAFGDYLMEEVNRYYDKMNKVYIKLYGIDLPKVENYWMATSEHKDAIDIQGDYYQQTSIPSALKERARGRVIPIPKSAWEKFNKHIAEAEYITGLGLDYMNIKKIFKSNRVKGKIVEYYGDGIYKDIMSDIESLSMASKIKEVDGMTGLFQKFLNNFVLAKIAVGVPVFVKQLTSCTNYAVDMPISKWTAGFVEGLSHPIQTAKFMMETVPYLKARFGQGYNEAVERVIREANKYSGKKVKWTEAMSSFTRYGDIGAIIFGGYPYLKYLQSQGDANAVDKFVFSTLRSQQAGTPVSLSPFQREKGTMRIFQAFNNTPMQYMRMLVDAVYQYKNGDITAKQCAKQLFNFGLIQPILYTLAGVYVTKMMNFGGDDDDDENKTIKEVVKQILINPIDAIPVFSDVIGAIFDKMLGQKNYGLRPVLVSDIEKLMQKIGKEEYDSWDIADIITPIVEMTTAAPMGRAMGILKRNFKD